jgi:glycosyltransferase involved in cell wall biosynthesis
MQLSIVVPTYNRRHSLQRLLRALEQQTVSDFEVVVVDDGSTDGTPELLESLAPAYRLTVVQQPNRGPAAARNTAVQRASGDLILFLDDDVVPIPELLEMHLAAHGADPNVVVIGPMAPPSNWPRPAWIRWEEEVLAVQYQAMLSGAQPCTPRQFYTANASLSRARFLEVGGFDHHFKRAEDVEMAYRMRDRGVSFLFLHRAVVYHYAERTFAAWSNTPYQYGRYDVIMYRDKGHEALWCAVDEFQRRNVLTRWLARSCVGHPTFVRTAVAGLRTVAAAADRLRTRRIARLALSGIFNLWYWQGVSDELGGPEPVWRTVAEWAAIPS